MAATAIIQEYNTSSSSFVTATNLNIGSTNLANLNPDLYPLLANSYSYEKWIKVKFDGSFTSVTDVSLYKSAGSYVTGEIINFTGQVTTWATPTNSASSDASSAIPTTEPVSANISIGGSLAGTITPGETTDFVILQASISPNSSAGQVNEKTLTFSWTEN